MEPMDPKELRRLYNHPVWPSPRARVVAKNLGCSTKRITHEQALEWLAHRANKELPVFLSMEKEDAWKALWCTYTWYGKTMAYDPLYGLFNRYKKYR